MLRTGQSPAPSQGRSTSASTPGSRPTPGVLLPRTLASPRTGLAPAGCRELVARLRRGALLSVLLGARAAGRTFLRNQPCISRRRPGPGERAATLPPMAGCCPSRDYHRFFNQRFARRLATRYRKRGLDPTAQTMVQFLRQLGLEGASVLEIGGGGGGDEPLQGHPRGGGGPTPGPGGHNPGAGAPDTPRRAGGHFGADHWVEGRPTEEGQGAALDLSAARRRPELFVAGECLAEGPPQTLQNM